MRPGEESEIKTHSIMMLTANDALAIMQYPRTVLSSTMLQFLVRYQGAPLLTRLGSISSLAVCTWMLTAQSAARPMCRGRLKMGRKTWRSQAVTLIR